MYDYDRELISLGVNVHSKDFVKMRQLEHKKLIGANDVAHSSAELEEQQNDAQSAYSTAASSEKLAGKIEPEGVQSYDGKLERNDLDSSQSTIEVVMEKSTKNRQVYNSNP